jgi:tRNA A-37 threonylcarbamoyl transferase component Bud32
VGAYQLLEELEQGGMGIVYKARHVTLGRVVALKMMRADALARPQDAQRFEREMRAVARLNHPHIIPIYEVGRHENRPYYTMAYAPGGSLARHRQRLPADPRAVLVLMEKVARAVHYAHEQGIVHRDLKPGNVLLDERGEPLVGDFGLAKLHDSDVELTQTGAVLGTPAYMAPEQAAGRTRDIGPPTDVWALGVMLYEFLAGRRPFQGDSGEEMKQRIRTDAPARLRSVAAGVDPRIEAVVHQCLHKATARRYATAAALADDLARCLRGEQPGARREPWTRRLWRDLRRQPLRSAALLFGVAAALGLLTAGIFGRWARPPQQPAAVLDPPVFLLRTAGPPPPGSRWLAGEKDATILPVPPGEPFSCQSGQLSLLELRTAPPWKRYRFEAEVRHESSTDGSAGIFFAYLRRDSPQGLYHTFWVLGFADWGGQAGTVDLDACRLQDAEPHRISEASLGPPVLQFPSVQQTGPPKRWRKLAVEVTPDEVRAFWEQDTQPIRKVPQEQLEAQGARLLSRIGLEQTEDRFTPDTSLGLYVQGGAASFQNVVLKQLP